MPILWHCVRARVRRLCVCVCARAAMRAGAVTFCIVHKCCFQGDNIVYSYTRRKIHPLTGLPLATSNLAPNGSLTDIIAALRPLLGNPSPPPRPRQPG